MWIRKRDIEKLSADIRRIIDGQETDIRDNKEGVWSILKNDIHTLASLKNEQARTLRRERDTMAENLADISHQIKTPLTSMAIMTDLLDNARLTEKETEFLANIKSGLARLLWLADALLKMAKLDAGAARFRTESVSARELIARAARPLSIQLELKEQRIEILPEARADNGSVVINCDRRWTCEALTNIIKNASEYSPKGGVIYTDCGENPICAWISVTDTGGGIPKDKIAGLFRRFTGSHSDKGYGIGLPLALAVMRGQNGDIEVSGGGGEGKGAVFTLKFYK